MIAEMRVCGMGSSGGFHAGNVDVQDMACLLVIFAAKRVRGFESAVSDSTTREVLWTLRLAWSGEFISGRSVVLEPAAPGYEGWRALTGARWPQSAAPPRAIRKQRR